MQFNTKSFKLERYPKTNNKSLQPWSAADELLLETGKVVLVPHKNVAVINDSFGALATALHHLRPLCIVDQYSQLKSARLNLTRNKQNAKELKWCNHLKLPTEKLDVVLLKIPKTIELFELYLSEIHKNLDENAVVLCGFMTRNFTAGYVEIAQRYFEETEQTLAVKKARVLMLKSPKKESPSISAFHTVPNDLNLNLKQFAGVFSANKIDIATTLLLAELPQFKDTDKVLDLACGNGVVGAFVRNKNANCEIHMLDNSHLAVSSAKLNVSKDKAHFHWSNSLNAIKEKEFDYIFCNPPFHFEYENTIEISLKLFEEAAEHLAENGTFMLVANTHLNYKTHLPKHFKSVKQVLKSGKYEVISCRK
jgi:16S rRNA G1207 methylase RsmC